MLSQYSYKSLLYFYSLIRVRLRAKQFKDITEIINLIKKKDKIEVELHKRIDNGEMI